MVSVLKINANFFVYKWKKHLLPKCPTYSSKFSIHHYRFLDSMGEVEKPAAYMPFGLGHRSCLGGQLAEAQTFLFFVCLMHQTFICPPGQSSLNVRGEYINFVHQPEQFTIRLLDNSARRDAI